MRNSLGKEVLWLEHVTTPSPFAVSSKAMHKNNVDDSLGRLVESSYARGKDSWRLVTGAPASLSMIGRDTGMLQAHDPRFQKGFRSTYLRTEYVEPTNSDVLVATLTRV
jgi:hypothetical protein